MADAAVALDMGRLDDQERRAGIGQHAEMHHVPVGGAAVIGAVLAHGRDHDAVCKFEVGKLIGREQAHWSWEGYSGLLDGRAAGNDGTGIARVKRLLGGRA